VRNPGERLARAVWVVAALKLLAHLLTTGRFGYGYFVDELYFNACAKHLAWGYVDMPPFHPALTAAVKAVLGPSLFAIRVLPAVAGAALVVLTAILARDLGAGAFGQLLRRCGRPGLLRHAQLFLDERVGAAALDRLHDPARRQAHEHIQSAQ
jgi:hypothetical protein